MSETSMQAAEMSGWRNIKRVAGGGPVLRDPLEGLTAVKTQTK